MQKYYLDFNGSIGDFIKQHRKAKKINSVDLSKELGKSGAYISQIENGHNKKPDYDMLVNIFKRIGIPEDRIEDYLEAFGFLSPQREEMEIQRAIEKQNMSFEEYKEIQKQEDEFFRENHDNFNNGDVLLEDIFKSDITRINSNLKRIAFGDSKGFNFLRNIEKTFNDMPRNHSLYLFMLRFFENDLNGLDEQGMIKVINTLYDEINRIEKDSSWGEPKLKEQINKL
ncbi:helix-turn-helix domain-containing protein [Oceanobacillus caeni]